MFFYGDVRQNAGRVSVTSTVQTQTQTQSASVTVSSQSPVDEPVATVYVRAGCENKATRRYVVLAELAAAVVPGLPVAAPVAIQALRADKAKVAAPRTTKPVAATSTSAVDAAPAPGSAPAARPATNPPRAEGRRAHLKLAPLDLWVEERDPTLKLSHELLVVDGEDPQERTRAAALWRSLNATPQDVLGAESRRQTLESDLKGLHAITVKNRQLLDDMTLRLGKAEAGRYSNPLVYALLAGLMVCGLAIVFLGKRAIRGALYGAPWWTGESVANRSESVEFGDSLVPKAGSTSRGTAGKADPPLRAPGPSTQQAVDIDLAAGDDQPASYSVPAAAKPTRDTARATPNQPVSRASGHMDFGHSMSASLLRSVNTKEMLDVRQQAEFFMTLGQHDEAVDLLRDSVDTSVDVNPLVSLELLQVLHTLGRKAEFDQYRIGFNAVFNGHVPVYAEFSQPGSGLEAYPVVCRRIVALWPSEEAVAFIESCLVRTRKESGGRTSTWRPFATCCCCTGWPAVSDPLPRPTRVSWPSVPRKPCRCRCRRSQPMWELTWIFRNRMPAT